MTVNDFQQSFNSNTIVEMVAAMTLAFLSLPCMPYLRRYHIFIFIHYFWQKVKEKRRATHNNQIDRQREKQTDKHTTKQTDKEKNRQTNTQDIYKIKHKEGTYSWLTPNLVSQLAHIGSIKNVVQQSIDHIPNGTNYAFHNDVSNRYTMTDYIVCSPDWLTAKRLVTQ